MTLLKSRLTATDEKVKGATCKSHEFLSHHRSRYDLMRPVVPSTVPYPDMRNW
jgi:hypothetical protein